MGQPLVANADLSGLSQALKALEDWRDKAADPALRNIDGFASQVSQMMKEVLRRVDKLEGKLEALAAIGGLAWQSGWLPTIEGDKPGTGGISPGSKRDVSWLAGMRVHDPEGESQLSVAGKGGLYL
jgi:hypothetical protein